MSTIEKAELLAGNAAEKTVAFTRNDTLTILKEIPLVELLDVVEAMEEVMTHRKEDRDGNYVMWIGEGTFLRCDTALAALRAKLPKEML